MRKSAFLNPFLRIVLAGLLASQSGLNAQQGGTAKRDQPSDHSAAPFSPSPWATGPEKNPARQPIAGGASKTNGVKMSPPDSRKSTAKTSPPVMTTELGNHAGTFIENRGQWDDRVRFQVRGGGKTLWLTNAGIVFDAVRAKRAEPAGLTGRAAPASFGARQDGDAKPPVFPTPNPASLLRGAPPSGPEPPKYERLAFSEDFVGGRPNPTIESMAPQPGIYNYFVGNDPAKWHTDIHGYGSVIYRNVWDGVDLKLIGSGADIEQEFIVQPGADLNQVQVAYRGINRLEVTKDGPLLIQTAFGELRESKPSIYQEIAGKRVQVEGRFKVTSERTYTFEAVSYRPEYALVIDPTLLYSTYLGGTGTDLGKGIAVDAAGNAYVAGRTLSSDFPTTLGSLQPTYGGDSAFVTKLSALGNSLVYSTYLGPAGTRAYAIAVDSAGEAYVTGGNAFSGMPTTANAFQTSCSDSFFLTKLNAQGNGLVYSTCLGSGLSGGYGPGAYAVAVGHDGKASITGYLPGSGSFPITATAFQSQAAGYINAFVAELDPSASGASSLVYSTYLGGHNAYGPYAGYQERGAGIAVDSFGMIYVTGTAGSHDFPVTPGAFLTTDEATGCYPSNGDLCPTAFVAKLNPQLSGRSSLIYSTFLGGSLGTEGAAVVVDSSGSAYVTGYTGQSFTGISNPVPFPTTAGAFQTGTGTSNITVDAFVTKFNAAGNGLVYSTLLGGLGGLAAPFGYGTGIALDESGDAYVAGYTRVADFPTTPDAFQPSYPGGGGGLGYNAFITKFNATGSALIYSSYLGGSSGDDLATGIAVDSAGDAYLTGYTYSADLPITAFAFQPGLKGDTDAFVARFSFGGTGGLSLLGTLPSVGGNSGTVTVTASGTGFQDGSVLKLVCQGQPDILPAASIAIDAAHIVATFDLTGSAPGTCGFGVLNPDGTSASLADVFTIENGGAAQLSINVGGPSKVRVGAPATFDVVVTNSGTVDADFVTVQANIFPETSASKAVQSSLIGGTVLVPPPGTIIPAGGFARFFLRFTPTVDGQCYQAQASAQEQGSSPSFCSALQAELQDLNKQEEELALELRGKEQQYAKMCSSFPQIILPSCLQLAGEINLLQLRLNNILRRIEVVEALLDLFCQGKQAAIAIAKLQSASAQPSAVTWTSAFCAISSVDPNGKVGEDGVGQPGYVRGSVPLPYVVNFENLPSATAPAARVSVTDRFDPNLDWTTLSLQSMSFGSTFVAVPEGVQQFTDYVDLRPVKNLIVGIQTDVSSGVFNLLFVSIDPTTGKPPTDPTVGLLDPGQAGSVSFAVTPRKGLATNSQIQNQATIVFDANAPIPTPAWSNTLDNTNPSSGVLPLPSSEPNPQFTVNWEGTDIGSGILDFTIYASDNGGLFAAFQTNTTATSATFTGQVGHTYAFYSIARDLVGNVEGAKTAADTSTTITLPPCATDVSGSISVARSGYSYNFATQRFYQTVKLTNSSTSTISGPISLVLDNLSTNASLFNASGTTSCAAPLGSPYIITSTASLAPGATVSAVLQFANPTKAATTYATRVLAGPGIQ
jgi:hypothetical protein